MDNQISISQLKKSFTLSGEEVFVVNQINPVDSKLETRFTPLNDLMSYIKSEIDEYLGQIMPVGSIKSYTGKIEKIDSMPGWLLCNGDQVSRTKYKKLFDVIGNTYGSSSSNSFYLPDLRGRTLMGFCNGSSPLKPTFGNWPNDQNITLGSRNTLGNFYHKLTENELPKHNHNLNHTHQYFNIAHMNTLFIDMYRHRLADPRGDSVYAFAPSPIVQKAVQQSKDNSTSFTADVSAYVGETGSAGGFTTYAGDNIPHNNMQPYVAINYLIKY